MIRLAKTSERIDPKNEFSLRRTRPVGRRPVSAAKRIFRFDRRIRHFGVISAVGKEILSATRPDLQELDPEEETKKLLKQIMLMKGILEGMNRYHGKIRGAIVMREKIMLIMFDGIDKVHIFSADPDFPLSKVERLGTLLDTVSLE